MTGTADLGSDTSGAGAAGQGNTPADEAAVLKEEQREAAAGIYPGQRSAPGKIA